MQGNSFSSKNIDVSKAGGNKPEQKELLDVKIELATEQDWEDYKKLRLQALSGKDKDKFGGESYEKAMSKSEVEWKKEIVSNDTFCLLAWSGNEVIGSVKAFRRQDGKWVIVNAYVREDVQGKGVGRKLGKARLEEIKRRGGTQVLVFVKRDNKASISLHLSEGFKPVSFYKNLLKRRSRSIKEVMKWQKMKLDLKKYSNER